jgi:hypothetical protein
MRVFNLTDVSTPTLVGCGLVNTSIQVGGRSIPPGGNETVEKLSADDRRFVLCGAISIGEPPPAYRAAKAVRPAPAVPEPLVEVEVKVEEEEPAEEPDAEVDEGLASAETHDMMGAPPQSKKPSRRKKRGSR